MDITSATDKFIEDALRAECWRLKAMLDKEDRDAFDRVWFEGLGSMEDLRFAHGRLLRVLMKTRAVAPYQMPPMRPERVASGWKAL